VTIIGVVGDFKNAGLALPPEPQIIVLHSQHPLVNYSFKDIVIRTASEPRLLAPEIRRQLRELDPDMSFAEVQTMEELVEAQTAHNVSPLFSWLPLLQPVWCSPWSESTAWFLFS
jgi:hypothetical protein